MIDCAPSRLLQPVLTHCDRSVANIPGIILLHQTDTALTNRETVKSDSISSEQPFAASGLIQL